eukprot:CAMPEP_0178713600 /NCGR_PEP_ID=MMETSP0699-20121125/19520_1 /TAXON_ID=265572 /ORGANISM="Extubocellulus spinifer, Strain CCMP396" /LENGTH=38 /DNA_ID= /DNA_START= /DNA_END= /DNA_ORIENTATION=
MSPSPPDGDGDGDDDGGREGGIDRTESDRFDDNDAPPY